MAEHAAPDNSRGPQHADGPGQAPSEPAHRGNSGSAPEPQRARHRRRVTTEPPPGSDPNPAPEEPRHASTENDEQLKRDVPPHWG